MEDACGGALFYTLIHHESIRKSIRIDTQVRGMPTCGVQVSSRSLDNRLRTHFGNCPWDEHHGFAGGGAARTGCRYRGGHRQCGGSRATPMPVRRTRVIRVQCRRSELPEVNSARQGKNGILNRKSGSQISVSHFSAEREGFEPPDPLRSTVFKTAAFDHSAISPKSNFISPASSFR